MLLVPANSVVELSISPRSKKPFVPAGAKSPVMERYAAEVALSVARPPSNTLKSCAKAGRPTPEAMTAVIHASLRDILAPFLVRFGARAMLAPPDEVNLMGLCLAEGPRCRETQFKIRALNTRIIAAMPHYSVPLDDHI